MITKRFFAVPLAIISFLTSILSAQSGQQREVAPLQNWATPLFWQPTHTEVAEPRVTTDVRGIRPEAVAAAANTPLGANALVFVAMTPCRVADTRSAAFPAGFGAPSLVGGISRMFPLRFSTTCSIPVIAQAYSLNVAVVPPGALGYLTMYPTGQALPVVATLNALQGQVVANAAIVAAGTDGSIQAFASNATDIVIDINGYYTAAEDANHNIALGQTSLGALSTGIFNTAVGHGALPNNTSGQANTSIGAGTLFLTTTGSYNTALGWEAGTEISTGNFNVDIASAGAPDDAGVIRIGDSTFQSTFFAAGVRGVTTATTGAVPVLVDSRGQFGTASSSRRFKEDIADMGDASSGLLRLRPVIFRYKKPYEDGSKPLDYGLIAEEVAGVYPDLVARGADGQIETVQYQKLAPMLLNELQKQHDIAVHQAERIRSLEDRLASLEALLTAGH